ncbi:hypothetical protein WICPIJ_009430 [Wickerhamomyces pijperi]|uniref:Nitrogen regulatory protein areA GATA-like domain-containing protein n=1 Tax=Wickerhamomyces pijperi TaxID=599730 RepID=A0A9P8PMU0_WICPI|nr:hypothetical protein WICPIJ_009430 [Wickerhamomyces pijperi]
MNFYSFDDQFTTVHKKQSQDSTKLTGVDYFQFNFTQAQIHNCWKLINSANRANLNSSCIPQSTDINRLENIAWRKWGKIRNSLKDVDPKTLNWYKDCDITWLYGPLVQGTSVLEQSSSVRRSCSAVSIPTLKARKLSDVSVDSVDSYPSSVESSPFDSEYEQDNDTDFEEDFEDECCVKPILKSQKSDTDCLLDCQTAAGNNIKIHKSVSFAEMVQIRQF